MKIEQWHWDDGNLEHLRAAGLSWRTVYEVAEEAPRFRVNKKNRAASHQMVGPDYAGHMWVLCIVEAPGFSGVWRAVTGWSARDHEKDWHRRAK